MNINLILPRSLWESSSSRLVKSVPKVLASSKTKITRDIFSSIRNSVLAMLNTTNSQWAPGWLNLLCPATRHHVPEMLLMIRNGSNLILRKFGNLTAELFLKCHWLCLNMLLLQSQFFPQIRIWQNFFPTYLWLTCSGTIGAVSIIDLL